MQTKQALLSKKGKQNRSSNRIYNKGERKFLQLLFSQLAMFLTSTLLMGVLQL